MEDSTVINVENETETLILTEQSEADTKQTPVEGAPEKPRIVRLPLSRIKQFMKMDPDCELISQDAVLLVTKEMFIGLLAQESAKITGSLKRKTVNKKDVQSVIDSIPQLCFLDGAID